MSPADDLAILDTRDWMAQVFEALGQSKFYPVYFHCWCSRDRTGVVAVVLLALGASREAIRADYRLTVAASMVIAPDSLEGALGELERRGGGAYLRDLGVADGALAVLRGQMIERIRGCPSCLLAEAVHIPGDSHPDSLPGWPRQFRPGMRAPTPPRWGAGSRTGRAGGPGRHHAGCSIRRVIDPTACVQVIRTMAWTRQRTCRKQTGKWGKADHRRGCCASATR